MNPPIIPRDQVAREFEVQTRVLARYERRGLIHVVRDGDLEGYPRSELGRLWTIISLQRDLGVNLAGVEAILQLRSQIGDLHQRLHAIADAMTRAIEEDEV